MTDLIKINNDGEKSTVDGRELHSFLEVGKDFSTWIANRIESYDFQEGKDFTTILGKSTGGRPSKEYHISIDMAKELSMVERNEKGKEARQYFIEKENQARKIQKLIERNDPILMLAQSTGMLREEQIKQAHEIEELKIKIETIESTTANRKLIVEDPPAGYENKGDVIETVARITQTTKAIVSAVIDAYTNDIAKKKYLVERIDDLQIVQTWPVCYMTFDVINCVKHAVQNSSPVTECFSIFKTLGDKRMKFKRGA